ncbi:hypothetical protein PDO_5361, partial [Rhizobium sp. PDO1-076]
PFRGFERRLTPTMRQLHIAGDKVFVDYSGKKLPIVDRKTGEIREAEIFVGVLGASSYTFAEATWTQTLPDWIGSHVRMFAFFGGVPRLIVYDYVPGNVIVDAAARYAAEHTEAVPVGVEQHLVRLQQVGPDQKSPTVRQLDMGDLKLRALAAYHGIIFTPIEMECFAWAKG